MPEETTAQAPAAPLVQDADAALADQQLSLQEFCTRRSKTDRRVELLGAFHFDEVRNGRVKDTESAFAQRLDAFANQPA